MNVVYETLNNTAITIKKYFTHSGGVCTEGWSIDRIPLQSQPLSVAFDQKQTHFLFLFVCFLFFKNIIAESIFSVLCPACVRYSYDLVEFILNGGTE